MSQETFEIYQVKDGDETRDFRFEPLERLTAAGRGVERGNYEQVCAGTFESGGAAATDTLNALFEQFNLSLPADYTGRSMSVSDIVVLRNEDGAAAYYVDKFGFTEVPEFLTDPQDLAAEQAVYKYYSTQRPVDIGTFPKGENSPVNIVNFDKREAVENGQFQAWGYLEYPAPLTDKQIDDYELRAAPDNPDVQEQTAAHKAEAISNYEDRKQTRIDRYRELSQKAGQESQSLYNQSRKMMDAIPLGQPLMPDHYSYNRDVNYRNRMNNTFGKSVAASDKAAYYEQKAEAAENNTAISSDDPAAIDKLKDKLAQCEQEQTFMKKVNTYYRKHKTCVGCEGVSSELAAKLNDKMTKAYSWETAPFPSWALSNNNAEIHRLKGRISELERAQNTEFAGWAFEGGKVVANKEINRLQILFDDKPDEAKRNELKNRGFRWSPTEKAWQRQLNGNGIYAAKCVVPEKPRPIAEQYAEGAEQAARDNADRASTDKVHKKDNREDL